MDGFLPPVVIEILASIKDFTAKKDEVLGGMKEIQAEGATTGDKLKAVGNKVANFALMGAAAVGVAALKLAYDYGEALDQMARSTNLTKSQVDEVARLALQVSTATATSSTDVISGYTQLVKAGFSVADATTAVGAAAKFAKAQNTSLSDTLTAAIGIQNLHIAGTKNVSQTMDIFTTAIKGSQLTANDLTQALSGKSLSAFAAYHIDLRTAITLLAGFADQNLKGTRAQAALGTGFAALEKPMYSQTGHLSNAATALAKLHLNQQTLAEEARQPGGMLTVLRQINTAWAENATATQKAQGITAFMNQIFGATAGKSFSNLLTELPKLTTMFNNMDKSGSNASAFQQWLSTPAGAVQKFKVAVENTLTSVGNVLLPDLTKMLNDVTNFATAHPEAMKAAGVVLGGIVAIAFGQKVLSVLGPLAKGLGKLFGLGGSGAGAGLSPADSAKLSDTATSTSETAANTAKIAGATEVMKGEEATQVAEEGTADLELLTADIELAKNKSGSLISDLVKGLVKGAPEEGAIGLRMMGMLEDFVPALVGPAGAIYVTHMLMAMPGRIAAAANALTQGVENPGGTGGTSSYAPAPNGSGGYVYQNIGANGVGPAAEDFVQITKAQLTAIDSYFKAHHLQELDKSGQWTQQFVTAVENFANADLSKKTVTDVTVNIS